MQRKGFTLVELLVVVGIIGVLASVSIVSLNSVRQKGRDAKRISEVKQMQSGLEAYFTNAGSYPVQGTAAAPVTLGAVNFDALCTAGFAASGAGCPNAFMQKVSKDALSGTAVPGANPAGTYDYKYHSADSAGADCAVGPCPSYEIDLYLEAGTGTYAGGKLTKVTPSGITQ